jgi:hypothetical protein
VRIFTLWGNQLLADTGEVLVQVHDPGKCEGSPCTVHGPSDHHMREWPLEWQSDRNRFDRICLHGEGHPDPDQFAFWRETHEEHRAWHPCDGCCRYRCPEAKEEQ